MSMMNTCSMTNNIPVNMNKKLVFHSQIIAFSSVDVSNVLTMAMILKKSVLTLSEKSAEHHLQRSC